MIIRQTTPATRPRRSGTITGGCLIAFLVSLSGCASVPSGAKPDHAWADWAAINTCLSVSEIGSRVSGPDLNNAVRDRSASLFNQYTRLSLRLAPYMGISEKDRLEIIADEVALRGFPSRDDSSDRDYGRARTTLMAEQLKCEVDLTTYQSRPWA